MNAQAAESVGAASDDSGDGDGEQVTPRSLTDMDDVGSMDEIQMLPEETDGEYTKMAGEMTSLEGMQEDEANEDDDEDAHRRYVTCSRRARRTHDAVCHR